MQSYVILYNSKSFNNSRGERISLNLFQYSKLIFLILNSHLCYYTVEKVQSFVYHTLTSSESHRTFHSVTVSKPLLISANQNMFWKFLDRPVDPTWLPPVALRRTGEGHTSGGEWSPARRSGSHQNGVQWTGSWRLETRSEHL